MKMLFNNVHTWIKKITYKIYTLVFDQLFFISTILIAFVINSFFSDEVNNLLGPIKFLIENRVYSITIVVIWGLICFIKNASDLRKVEIEILNEKIKNKERQIETNAGILEGKYGEFAESIRRNNINKVLKRSVQKFPIVEACHLYSYEYNRIKNNVDIKLNFLDGYEQEGICINVLKQKYYSIDKNVFRKLDNLINEYENMPYKKFNTFITNLNNDIENCKTDESIKYRLRKVVFGIVDTKYGEEENVGLIESDEVKFNFKTGILGGILSSKKGSIYSYKGSKEIKEGRIYYSTAIFLGEEYILNIAIDGRGMNGKELDEFFKVVVNMIKEEYNYIIRGGVTS